MAQDVVAAVRPFDLEVAVIGCQPLVNHPNDLDGPLAEEEAARRLFTTMTGIAVDPDEFIAFENHRTSPD